MNHTKIPAIKSATNVPALSPGQVNALLLDEAGAIAAMERGFNINTANGDLAIHGALALVVARAVRSILSPLARMTSGGQPETRWDFTIASGAEPPFVAITLDDEDVASAALAKTDAIIDIAARLNSLDRLTPLLYQALAPGGIGESSFEAWRRALADAMQLVPAPQAANVQEQPQAAFGASRYFALLDTGAITMIPGAATFEDAANADIGNVTWIFSEDCLRSTVDSARAALAATPDEVHWTLADEAAAREEGWNVFECSGGEDGLWQIQRIDDPHEAPKHLASDALAWRLVAEGGQPHHAKARALIKRRNPLEWAKLCKATGIHP